MFKFSALASTVILVCSGQSMAVNITGDTVTTDLTVNGQDIFLGPTSTSDQFRLLWRPHATTTTIGTLYFDAERQQAMFEWRDDVAVAAKRKMTLDHSNVLRLYKADGTTEGLVLIPETNRLDLKGGGIYSNGTALLTVGAGSVPTFTSLLTSGDATINNVKVGTGSGNIQSNTVVGTTALVTNSTGSFNSAFGDTSLELNLSGSNNSAFGAAALADNSTGSYNVGLGVYALGSNTTGGSNTGIGHQAGMFLVNGTTPMTAPASCVFIGATTKGKLINDSNAIVIGAGAVSEGSNTAVIGNTSITKTYLRGTAYIPTLSVAGSTTLTGTTTAGAVTAASMVISGATTANGTVTLNGGTSANSLNVTGTTASTSPTTGALTVAGGIGVAGTVYANSINANTLTLSGQALPAWLSSSGFLKQPDVDAKGYQTAAQVAAFGYQTAAMVDSAIISKGFLTSAGAAADGFLKQPDVDAKGYQTATDVSAELDSRNLVTASNIGATLASTPQVELEDATVQGDTVLNGKVTISQVQGDIPMFEN